MRSSMHWCWGCRGSASARQASSPCCRTRASASRNCRMCRCPSADGQARSLSVIATENIDSLNPEQLRQELRTLRAEVALKDEIIARQERESAFKQTTIDKL